jgi:hypothetical protein
MTGPPVLRRLRAKQKHLWRNYAQIFLPFKLYSSNIRFKISYVFKVFGQLSTDLGRTENRGQPMPLMVQRLPIFGIGVGGSRHRKLSILRQVCDTGSPVSPTKARRALSNFGPLFLMLLIACSASRASLAQSSVNVLGNATPANAVEADYSAVTLGVKLWSTKAGTISGIRFYRGARNSSGYTVKLFTAGASLLASAKTSTDTCAVPCWEQVNFASPVSLAANTTYIAAYYTSNGRYADDTDGLRNGKTSGPLTAPASSAVGGNGVYTYSTGFPNQTWYASNYPSSGLPAGVTLSAIDGETMAGNVMSHNYYARNGFTNPASSTFDPAYNNGGWDDPRFFPIGNDYSFYPSNSTTTFKTLGLNFTHRVTADTDLTMLKNAAIWVLLAPGEGSNPGSETIGWHIEEPSTWSSIVSDVQGIGSGLTGRFLQVAFTWNQLYYGTISGAPGNSTMPYVMSWPISTSVGNRHLNIPGDDEYWFAASPTGFGQTYPGGNIYNNGIRLTTDQMARGDHYGDMVDTMRGWVTTATPQSSAAPNCPYIETEDGLVGDAGFRRILPQEWNWADWSTIVHGARCLLYFGTTSNYGSGSTFGFSQSILSGASISMFNQAIATHALVKNLAPILNSPFALGYASVIPVGYVFPTPHLSLINGIDIMSKYYNGGSYSNATGTFGNGLYIFATVRGSEAQANISATFTIKNTGKTSVPVVGEDRNVTVTNGGSQFTDTFANAYTVHIYGPF